MCADRPVLTGKKAGKTEAAQQRPRNRRQLFGSSRVHARNVYTQRMYQQRPGQLPVSCHC